MTHCVFLSIDYDVAYKAVVVQGPDDHKQRFETGDAVKDYFDACVHAAQQCEKYKVPCLTSSSLEGFVWDIGGYQWDANDMLVAAPRRSQKPFPTA